MIVEQFTCTVRTADRFLSAVVWLAYHPADPLAVKATFFCDGRVSTWRFARQLLVDAYAVGVSGLGKVRICRVDVFGETLLWVTLDGHDGQAAIGFPGDLVACWLDATESLVPVGAEVVDVDGLVGQYATDTRTQRVIVPGRLRSVPVNPWSMVSTRPGRSRSRRRCGEDPAERPPRYRPAPFRLTAARGPDDDGEAAGRP